MIWVVDWGSVLTGLQRRSDLTMDTSPDFEPMTRRHFEDQRRVDQAPRLAKNFALDLAVPITRIG